MLLCRPETDTQWKGVSDETGFVAVLVLEPPARLQGDVTLPVLSQPVLPCALNCLHLFSRLMNQLQTTLQWMMSCKVKTSLLSGPGDGPNIKGCRQKLRRLGFKF